MFQVCEDVWVIFRGFGLFWVCVVRFFRFFLRAGFGFEVLVRAVRVSLGLLGVLGLFWDLYGYGRAVG